MLGDLPRRGPAVTVLTALAVVAGLLLAGAPSATAKAGDDHGHKRHATASAARPCDLYAAGGTPCVAAHSMTRGLFADYTGPLYRVERWSDRTSLDVTASVAGGYPDVDAQDAFCDGTSCTVTTIYDQTANHNDLTIEGPGGNGGQNAGANAAALPTTLGSHRAYGLYVSAGVGYRDNQTTGVATGSQAEGMYMVTSGTHVNDRCCFDYGNAETSTNDTGNGHMDAINFGTECWFRPCSGSGPWVQADLENGLFAGGDGSWAANTGRNSAFVTAMLKNDGTTRYAIKDGDARSGGLATRYDGPLPTLGGYTPMSLEGAIVLGTGGDDSNGSVGSFFEGVMTRGYPSDATEAAVQADVVAAGYSDPSAFPQAGATYRIENVNNGLVAGAADCGTGDNTTVDLEDDIASACQRFAFIAAPDHAWTIVAQNSGKVLDAYYCGQADGTRVDLDGSNGLPCQQWQVVPAGNDRYEIVSQNSGMVLDAQNCGATAGTLVQLYQWLDNPCQEWRIVKVG